MKTTRLELGTGEAMLRTWSSVATRPVIIAVCATTYRPVKVPTSQVRTLTREAGRAPVRWVW